jgi:hypothetical protein
MADWAMLDLTHLRLHDDEDAIFKQIINCPCVICQDIRFFRHLGEEWACLQVLDNARLPPFCCCDISVKESAYYGFVSGCTLV